MIFKNKEQEVKRYLEEYKALVNDHGLIPKPNGHFCLVRVVDIEETSDGGIVLATSGELNREQNGHDVGVVLIFGPTCYKGFEDCKDPKDWGVTEGDVVEFNRYDGKLLRNKHFKQYRVITDSDIHIVYRGINDE